MPAVSPDGFPFRARLGVLLAAILTSGILLLGGFDRPMDHELRVVRDELRTAPASGEIVLVEIDARSLAEIDTWPWPRSLHGDLVRSLSRAGADTIAFDIDFSSRSNRAEDAAFASALARSESLVLLPAFRQFAGAGRTDYVDSEPIAELRREAFLASVNIEASASGVVRRALLGVHTNGLPRPSLPAMLSDTQGAADADFPIDFAIDPATIPRLSYADVLAGRADLASVAGRSVMVGATAIELGDRYAVPGHGVLPGVVIQALAAETLLAGGVPAEFGPLPALLLMLGAVLVLIAPLRREWRLIGFAAAGLSILALPLVAEAFFHATFATAAALGGLGAAAAASGAGLAWRKFERAVLHDRETGMPNAASLRHEAEGSGEIRLIAARIEGFAERAALLSTAELQIYFREIERRLGIALGGEPVYRIEEALVAWRADGVAPAEIGDQLDAVAALFRHPVEVGSQRVDTNFHFGIAEGEADDVRRLLAGAVFASERAMEAGHRWERYVEGDEDRRWQVSVLGELDEALRTGALWVAFQPKFRIADRRIVSAEALVRWRHPERGMIPPDRFIPLVEKRGQIAELTLFTTERALEAVRDWRAAGLRCGVAINVSAKLLDDRAFLDTFLGRIAASGVDPGEVTIEVTESAAFENPDAAIAAMHRMRRSGLRLAIDDYGTGQSTLSYLRRLPIDELKIDKSFVQSIEASPSDRILVRSTIDLAHDLGLEAVAEGVETEECANLLAELGCDVGQGFLVGRPVTAGEFMRLEARSRQEAAAA